jgi:hypothetical protein
VNTSRRSVLLGLAVVALVVAAVLVLGGRPPSPVAAPLPPPDTGKLGKLWSFNGEQVPWNVLSLAPGPGHCGWEDVLFLRMSTRLGQPTMSSDDLLEYVRDPENRWAAEPPEGQEAMTLGRFEPSVPKSADAVFTGYAYDDGMELWRSDAATNALVFLRRGDTWEQWPRSRTYVACS